MPFPPRLPIVSGKLATRPQRRRCKKEITIPLIVMLNSGNLCNHEYKMSDKLLLTEIHLSIQNIFHPRNKWKITKLQKEKLGYLQFCYNPRRHWSVVPQCVLFRCLFEPCYSHGRSNVWFLLISLRQQRHKILCLTSLTLLSERPIEVNGGAFGIYDHF